MNDLEIYKKNVADLQEQLHEAHLRIKDLTTELESYKKPRTNALGLEVDEFEYRIIRK